METSRELTSRDCLVVILRPKLTLARGPYWPVISGFRADDTIYREIGLGDLTGFYDWLRRSNGELLGARYWPSEPNGPLFEAARSLTYTKIGSKGF